MTTADIRTTTIVRDRLARALRVEAADDSELLRALLAVLEREPVVMASFEVAALGQSHVATVTAWRTDWRLEDRNQRGRR